MNIDYILALMPAVGRGTVVTLQIFFCTLIFALPLGLPFALGSISKIPPLRWISKFYIWVFRGTPLMLQLFFMFYALPLLSGGLIRMERFPTAVVTFVLNYAAYFAEIYRAGIESIDRGQYEAAKSLGFSPWQTMRIVIIPQTIKRILPPVANESITLVKDTALVYTIGLTELLMVAKDSMNRDVDVSGYIIVALVYLALTALLTFVARKIERRFSRHERESV